MLRPKVVRDKKVMGCSCGYSADKAASTVTFSEKREDKVREFEVVEKETSVHPVIDEECPKCKNPKAFTWSQQMRAGDEPETIFYKCTECAHQWRGGK
jgi:DNA-directed RNA polymerase subunit M